MAAKQPKKSTEHPAHSAHHHASKFSDKQKKIALLIVALAFVMDLLDSTIVNIAIPSIQENLGASYATIQWLIAGYSLTFATMLITAGRMGDVFGYKKLFLWGVGGFTLTSLAAGLAWNSEVLIIARLLQGVAAALMVPQVMSLMQILYKPSERTQVMGIFGALAGVAASLGPVVGGLLIHWDIAGLDWRPIFLINIPIGIFALWAGSKFLPDGKSPHPLKLDITGTLIIILAMTLLIFPLIEGRDLDWPAWTFVMMLASVPMLALFAWWQFKKDKKDHSPLVVPALLRTPTFIKGLIINLTFEGAMLGFFLPFTLILQVGLGYEVVKAALTGIPTAIGISVTMAVFSQKIIPKLGRYALSLGVVLMAVGLLVLQWFIERSGLNTTPWEFIPGLLITGAGMAMIMAPIFAVVLTDVDPKHAGSASGVLSAVQQLGGAIGVALIGVFFFGQLSSSAVASFDEAAPAMKQQLVAAHIPEAQASAILGGAKQCFVDMTHQKDTSETPESCKKLESPSVPANLPPEAAAQLKAQGEKVATIMQDGVKQANTDNFVNAFRTSVVYELCILAVVFVLSFGLPRHIRPEAYQEAA